MTVRSVTAKKKELFLKNLAQSGNVTDSAKSAGWVRQRAYENRESDFVFAEAWQNAEQEYADKLEREADRRAIEGVNEPRFYEGEVCGHVRKYSDTLLIFRLKAIRPEKYRERVEVAGNPDNPLHMILERIDGKGIPKPICD